MRGSLQKDTRNLWGVMKYFCILIGVVVTSPHGFSRLPELSTEKGEFYLCKLDLNFLIQNRKAQKYLAVLNYFVHKSLINVYNFLHINTNKSFQIFLRNIECSLYFLC